MIISRRDLCFSPGLEGNALAGSVPLDQRGSGTKRSTKGCSQPWLGTSLLLGGSFSARPLGPLKEQSRGGAAAVNLFCGAVKGGGC